MCLCVTLCINTTSLQHFTADCCYYLIKFLYNHVKINYILKLFDTFVLLINQCVGEEALFCSQGTRTF